MLKFLRQYNQWILVVGGSLLLITFLMPTAIQNCAQESATSGAVWATYDGGKVTGEDLAQARQEMVVLEQVGNAVLSQLGADRDPAHWWLLAHEAKLAGLVGGLGDGEAVVSQMAAQRAEQAKTNPNVPGTTPETMLSELIRSSRATRDVVLETIAKAQGVARMVNLAANVDRVSDKRFEHVLAESLLGVSGDMFVIDARKDTPALAAAIAVSATDDAALLAHLKLYADKVAGQTSALDKASGAASGAAKAVPSPFGYRVSDRFKLEWITIPKSSIVASVQNAPELATLALKKRFAQDPAKYGAPADGSAAFATFEAAVRTRATDDLVKERTDAISKFTTDQLGLAQRSLKRDGTYFVLPAEWATQMPAFDALAQTVAQEFSIPAPAYQSSGAEWMTGAQLESDPMIGRVSTDRFGTRVTLAQLVAGAKELTAQNLNAPFQLNLASPPLTADGGDVVFARMIAAEPSRAATDLAEVRDAVVKDVLALARFEWLKANQESIATQSITDGLRTVAAKFGAEVVFARDLREANPQFVQYGFKLGTAIPGVGTDADALSAIVAKAIKLPLTEDVSKLPLAERTIVVPAADFLTLIVLQVSELTPLTTEQYAMIAANPQSVGIVRDPSYMINPTDLFSFDSLCKRYGFKLTRLESDTASAADDAG
jgi:hypothetical protein